MKRFIEFVKKVFAFSPWRIFFAIILMLLAACSEGVGLLLLKPLLMFANINSPTQYTPENNFIVRVLHFLHIEKVALGEILALYVFILSVIAILNYVKRWFNGKLQLSFIYDLQQKLYAKFINASWQKIAKIKRSNLMQLLTHEIDQVAYGLSMLIQIISVIVLTGIYLFVACVISWELTLIAIACGMLLYSVLHFQNRLAYKIGEKDYECFQQLYGCINDHLLSAKLVKAYCLEEKFTSHFENTARKLRNLGSRYILLQGSNSLLYTIGGGIIFSVIFYFSITEMHVPLASLFVLLVIFARLTPRISGLQQNYQDFARTLAAFYGIENMLTSLSDNNVTIGIDCNVSSISLQCAIKFNNVSFAYDSAARQRILSDVNLEIPARKITAFAGHSGVGKSTLIDLIIGLLDPISGEILIDDKPIASCRRSGWYNSIAYVPQNDHLLNGTIRENLIWAADNITAADIDAALKQAAIYDVVQSLSDKLETNLGDDGCGLSGGEKQRILLARALLRRPALLILDEATSALDPQNEAIVFDAIRKLSSDITVIVVTHRMSVFDFADRVFFVNNGKVESES